MFGIGIIGCGLIGNKRANALGNKGKLLICCDIDGEKAENLAKKHGAIASTEPKDIFGMKEVDIVIISTLHDSLSFFTKSAIEAGKHVLVEKPGGRSFLEIEDVIKSSKDSSSKIRVGFNHRFHPSIIKAKEIVDCNLLGSLMFIRARYGHGGRVGYEKEWRANPILSGGGEIIDQGSHLIDLSRMFLGDFVGITGYANTYFWNMDVEDNGFMILRNKDSNVAFLHASCTEWKNMFSMEIYGKKGKLDINGLGGSYGKERIIHYKMSDEMGPPDAEEWSYEGKDESWAKEMNELYKDIEQNRDPNPGLKDVYEVLKIIDKVYKESGYDYSKKPS